MIQTSLNFFEYDIFVVKIGLVVFEFINYNHTNLTYTLCLLQHIVINDKIILYNYDNVGYHGIISNFTDDFQMTIL